MTDPESHYRRLEQAYQMAPCNQALQLKLSVTAGAAEVRIAATPSMHHAAGAVHGSFYFKALDDAAYFAANSLVEDALVLTASFSLELLRPVATGEMRASGRVRKAGKNLIFAESVLYDGEGNELATGRGTFARTRMPIPD